MAEALETHPKLDPVVIHRDVEAKFGGMEQLAHFMMVERPELLEADPETIAAVTGFSVGVIRYLLYSSKDFLALIDSYLAREEWSPQVRRSAYKTLAKRAKDDTERLGDVVRASQYLDSKAGVSRVAEESAARGVQIQVRVVQEGSRDFTSHYKPLIPGALPAQGGHMPSRIDAKTVDVGGEPATNRPESPEAGQDTVHPSPDGA